MASTGVTSHLPPVKSVMVYRNGDPFFSGRRFVVNQRQIATMDALLNDITLNIGAPLAVRTLYTPRYGHRVADLGDLQQGAQYVAAGSERFKKLDYLSAGLKKAVEPTQSKTLARPNVSAKWRKVITLPCIIHVFRNGDILSPAMRLIIPRHMLKNLEQILSLISEKAMLRTGAVRRICTLEGFTVTSAEELETGQCYVAVGSERFKKLPYVEILLNKATGSSADRHYAGDRGLHRRIESRKMFPQDTHSDSTLLNSPEREGRRVKSTGDDAERESSPQPVKRRGRRAEREGENSVFYARPVRVRRQQPVHRPTPKVITEPSVFKASESTMREEVRGAEEVTEDENTAVELPVDQREAEIVEDEELPEREFAASEIQTWDDTSAPQRETPQEHTPPHETNKYESESHHSRPSSSSSLRLSPRHEETQQEPIRRSHDEQTHRDADSPRQAAEEDAQD